MNAWCQTLGITPPKLEAVVGHREANTFSLLLVALLERGEPMILPDVAARFEAAGIAERSRSLLSLQRCKPGRPPVYRVGDLYHLDPHDPELDLWAFRLDLRPPKFARPPVPAVEPTPVVDPDAALTPAELDLAWKDASLTSWSAQRLALAVLDAFGGPRAPAEVVAAVTERTKWHRLTVDPVGFRRRNSAVEVLPDGRWSIAEDAGQALSSARAAVRDRVAQANQRTAMYSTPEDREQRRAESERVRAAHGARLARMSRALIVAFPPDRPQAAALLDVTAHQITTFVGDELPALRARLACYDIIGGVDVRGLLRALEVEPGARRLAELGPPQKTKRLNRSNRTLHITTAMLVQTSCGIDRPFTEEEKLARTLERGQLTKLRSGLEKDLQSLHALYEYGRLHGYVCLRWGRLDERFPASWAHPDEPRLHDLKKTALALDVPLELVVGSAPGWEEPWARLRLAHVERGRDPWELWLVDEDGTPIDDPDVQRARLTVVFH